MFIREHESRKEQTTRLLLCALLAEIREELLRLSDIRLRVLEVVLRLNLLFLTWSMGRCSML